MTAPVLAVDDLHVRIGGSHILQGVGFTVAPGTVTALLGRNGAGKTTTLKALLGLVPRSGHVAFRGAPIGALPTHRVVTGGIAYVPEDREVFASLTVAENLTLARRRGVEARYDLVHELFPELRRRAGQYAGTLSGGQQQMLAIGRALLTPADLLLIDEPTKGLAPTVVADVVAALRAAATHATVLLVEQNLPVVADLADDAVVLADGAVAYTGTAAGLLGDGARTNALLGVARRAQGGGSA